MWRRIGIYTGLIGLLASVPLYAGSFQVTIEIPRIEVAEYHRPYVAVWIAGEDYQVVTDLAVWYDLEMRNNEGEKWLKDMRQWWRRSGRTKIMPIDGVSSATRAPGKHQLRYESGVKPFENLAAGHYFLMIEAAREVGGRELLEVPFEWPLKNETVLQVFGETELGEVILKINP